MSEDRKMTQLGSLQFHTEEKKGRGARSKIKVAKRNDFVSPAKPTAHDTLSPNVPVVAHNDLKGVEEAKLETSPAKLKSNVKDEPRNVPQYAFGQSPYKQTSSEK